MDDWITLKIGYSWTVEMCIRFQRTKLRLDSLKRALNSKLEVSMAKTTSLRFQDCSTELFLRVADML